MPTKRRNGAATRKQTKKQIEEMQSSADTSGSNKNVNDSGQSTQKSTIVSEEVVL